VALGLGFSILSGGLTLACMALPIFVRTAAAGLRAVPQEWRRAAAALGLSQLTTLRQVVIPAATPALVAALLLAIGRSIAETAALLFTSGYVDRMPSSWLDSGRALSVHIHDLAMNVAGGESSAYASALVLVAILLGIDAAASRVAEGFVRKEARS
jgi:phosphate transport system permease protein